MRSSEQSGVVGEEAERGRFRPLARGSRRGTWRQVAPPAAASLYILLVALPSRVREHCRCQGRRRVGRLHEHGDRRREYARRGGAGVGLGRDRGIGW
jgi:hypothetical protein